MGDSEVEFRATSDHPEKPRHVSLEAEAAQQPPTMTTTTTTTTTMTAVVITMTSAPALPASMSSEALKSVDHPGGANHVSLGGGGKEAEEEAVLVGAQNSFKEQLSQLHGAGKVEDGDQEAGDEEHQEGEEQEEEEEEEEEQDDLAEAGNPGPETEAKQQEQQQQQQKSPEVVAGNQAEPQWISTASSLEPQKNKEKKQKETSKPTTPTTAGTEADAAAMKKEKEKGKATEKENPVQTRRSILRRISSRKDSTEPVIGTKVDEHHKNYVLMYVMLQGIRTTLSRCHAKPSRPLTDEDYYAAHKLAFDINGNEMTPSSKYDFKFKDYAPWVFRSLREHFGLDAADYLVSLTGRYVLSELGTPGKSGSFFYFSQDYRFIIKTISSTEHKFFRKILRNYHEYIMSNPNTLISRYYGLHRVKLSSGPKIHFVVMGNVFPPNKDIHETFDLKGSTVGRYIDLKEREKKAGKPTVLKDLNFLEMGRKIILGPEKSKLFLEQIRKDAEFLARNNIMDYSLLLGIHYSDRGNAEQLRDRVLSVFEPPSALKSTPSKKQRKQMKEAISRSGPVALDASGRKLPEEAPKERTGSVFYSDDGGYRSTDENNQPRNEIYHMGVIDILTPYDGIKRFEHLVKSINNNSKAISSVRPSFYAERFVDFLVNGTAVEVIKKNQKKIKKNEGGRDSDTDSRHRPSLASSESIDAKELNKN